VAADTGFPGGQRGVIGLTLAKSYPTYEPKLGCKYALAFYANPLAIQVKYFEDWNTLALVAGCHVDESGGVPRDPAKAAAIYLEGVAGKYKPTIALLTDKLSLQPRDLVVAIQQNLKQRGLYAGPADGIVSPATLDAVRVLGGEVSKSPPANSPPPSPPPPQQQKPPPTREGAQALFERAKTDYTSELSLRALADGGDANAQLLYGMLLAPAYKAERSNKLDARRAVQYFELATNRGIGAAAAWAALLYDTGYAELPRDPAKAANFAVRALELKNADIMTMLQKNGWGAGFWSALQRELSVRRYYSGTIVDRRNDRAILAARTLMEEAQ
jgi:peptidoglycan hydrolase-like protein with peptidoglycan-binding domain